MEETLLYKNTFDTSDDIASWVCEGHVRATVKENTLELAGGPGTDHHFVFWIPEVFPDRIRICWDFSPVAEPGLAMILFGAESVTGRSIFDSALAPRNGAYPQYHSGDIRTLHASYFRRRWPEERFFHLANLRKSPGFHLVAQGPDPLPDVADARGHFYRIEVVKDQRNVDLSINGTPLFSWEDKDSSTGPVVGGGRIGFRQMTPLVARYRNLEVWKL